jgi:hypothetical protein
LKAQNLQPPPRQILFLEGHSGEWEFMGGSSM